MTTQSHPAPIASASARTSRPWSLWAAVALLLFIAFGALPAGVLLIANPHGDPMGMPGAWIDATLFGAIGGWVVPGIVLFVVMGLGSLLVAYGLWARPAWPWLQRINPAPRQHWSWTLLLLEGAAQMIWISVQVFLMPNFFLQPVVFGIGLLLVLLALTPSLRHWTATKGA